VERNRDAKTTRLGLKTTDLGSFKYPREGVNDLVGNYYLIPDYHYKPLFRLSKIIKKALYEGVDK